VLNRDIPTGTVNSHLVGVALGSLLPVLELEHLLLGSTRYQSIVEHIKAATSALWRTIHFRSAVRSVANAPPAPHAFRVWARAKLLASYQHLDDETRCAEPHHPVHESPIAEAAMRDDAVAAPRLSFDRLGAFGSVPEALTDKGTGTWIQYE
jgi:hypothetical protein